MFSLSTQLPVDCPLANVNDAEMNMEVKPSLWDIYPEVGLLEYMAVLC